MGGWVISALCVTENVVKDELISVLCSLGGWVVSVLCLREWCEGWGISVLWIIQNCVFWRME